MKIKVEQRHINEGKISRCQECPVALAIQEQTGVKVSVYPMTGVFFGSGVIIPLPPIAQHFIGCFDYGVDVRPFEFDLPWSPLETTE